MSTGSAQWLTERRSKLLCLFHRRCLGTGRVAQFDIHLSSLLSSPASSYAEVQRTHREEVSLVPRLRRLCVALVRRQTDRQIRPIREKTVRQGAGVDEKCSVVCRAFEAPKHRPP